MPAGRACARGIMSPRSARVDRRGSRSCRGEHRFSREAARTFLVTDDASWAIKWVSRGRRAAAGALRCRRPRAGARPMWRVGRRRIRPRRRSYEAAAATTLSAAPFACEGGRACGHVRHSRAGRETDSVSLPSAGARALHRAHSGGAAATGSSAHAPELREGNEDYPGGRPQLGGGHLHHRRIAIAQLQHAAPSSSGRTVDWLHQFHSIEGCDLAYYGHGLMLGARVGGDEPRRGLLTYVMPRGRDRRGAIVVDRELHLHTAHDAMWRPVTDC